MTVSIIIHDVEDGVVVETLESLMASWKNIAVKMGGNPEVVIEKLES